MLASPVATLTVLPPFLFFKNISPALLQICPRRLGLVQCGFAENFERDGLWASNTNGPQGVHVTLSYAASSTAQSVLQQKETGYSGKLGSCSHLESLNCRDNSISLYNQSGTSGQVGESFSNLASTGYIFNMYKYLSCSFPL